MNIILTVDVECYSGDYEREVFGDGLGLEYLLRVLGSYDAVATFFVEALGATRWGVRPVAAICEQLAAAGQDIQLHLHPVVARLPDFEDKHDVLWEQDEETQLRLLRKGLAILSECGVEGVTAFRAGDFAADAATLRAMKRAGLRVSSNRDLDLKCSIRSRINDAFPVRNDVSGQDGIVDVPVTCLCSPLAMLDGPYRHMEIAAMGWLEMRDALVRMADAGYVAATILTHPREFYRYVKGKPIAIAKNRSRLESLVRFASEDRRFTMVPVGRAADADTIPRTSPPELTLKLGYTLVRVAEQLRHRVG